MNNNKLYKQGIIKVPRFEEGQGFYATEKSSSTMRKIRSKNTKTEIKFRNALWSQGCRYRLHAKGIIGKPDIIFVSHRLLLFVDGDFWHGHNWEEKKKRLVSNKSYWIPKIQRNMQRDIEVTEALLKEGWKVIRFWEHEIVKDLNACILKVMSALNN